jgi:hypothetical protein
MKMTDSEIFNFFATDENMAIALEIEKRVKELKDHVQRSFWAAFNSTFDLKLKSSEYVSGWKFLPFPLRRLKKGWDGCRIVPVANFSSHADMTFGQWGPESGYTIYQGVTKTGQLEDTSTMITLKTHLSAHKINDPGWGGWIGVGGSKYRIYQPDFLRRMVNEPETLVNEISSDFWNLFLEIRPIIELLNQENQQPPK